MIYSAIILKKIILNYSFYLYDQSFYTQKVSFYSEYVYKYLTGMQNDEILSYIYIDKSKIYKYITIYNKITLHNIIINLIYLK
jgi:hypothetical protein